MTLHTNPVKILDNLIGRLQNFNKKIDILAFTARQSMVNLRWDIAHHANVDDSFRRILDEFDEGTDAIKLYREWKQDLIIDYFNPRRYNEKDKEI